ncbi:hypothetical protein SGFS_007220 [Streptomyces graminofaciens]|uniref:WD40 repeat domain-containing protein n=1 Tax=Streptomyces graminofaciens TaxID=68212 RepID=A0ABN5V959_9ACTN|nr:WD40 repeat domain-containing protein [Streptomyces graminofaciens]BBC29428.1 hypothetical protein SGFS_007220 [Streptomyces graminofaciens]
MVPGRVPTRAAWRAWRGCEVPQTPSAHVGRVTTMVVSPDGSWLATASRDGTARIWDAATGQELHILTVHTASVFAVVVSPDGSWLATASRDGTARIWDAATGQELHTLDIFAVDAMVVSPDGAWIATTSFRTDTMRIWDAITGQELRTLTRHPYGVTGTAFSPDGTLLAITSVDGTIRICSPETGLTLTMMRTDSPLLSCAWTPDGRCLLVGGLEGIFGYTFRLASNGPH